MKKYGTGEVLPDKDDLPKGVEPFSEADKQALAAENAEADTPKE